MRNTSDHTFWGIKKKESTRNRDDINLQNDFIDLLVENMGGEQGFSFYEATVPNMKTKSVSQHFVDVISNGLYYLAPHWHKFIERGFKVPKLFELKGPYHSKLFGEKICETSYPRETFQNFDRFRYFVTQTLYVKERLVMVQKAI